jgi:hypothetical protein
MCTKDENIIQIARYSIGILCLIQLGLLCLVIFISIDFSSEQFYNIEDLELHEFYQSSIYTGFVFLCIAAATSLLGLTLVTCKRICCQKPLLFVFGLSMTFVFFSTLIFGSSLVMISESSESYLEEFCSGRVTVKYQEMLTQIVNNIDDAIQKIQVRYMCRQFYCPCDANNTVAAQAYRAIDESILNT